MSDSSSFGTIAAPAIAPLTAATDKLLHRAAAAASAVSENGKIDKSARDFESILLGSWLQQAEQSFAAVPGGDGEDDADAGKDQYQGIAMQSLGEAMTAAGGIGIARMIATQLHKSEDHSASPAPKGKV
jgi:Rod binding domain-containing protein